MKKFTPPTIRNKILNFNMTIFTSTFTKKKNTSDIILTISLPLSKMSVTLFQIIIFNKNICPTYI